jgi:hypothetical protein
MKKALGAGVAASLVLAIAAGAFFLTRTGSTQGALADAEANFRSSLGPGQAIHTITEHYLRQSPTNGLLPSDITIGPDSWTEESYTALADDGSVAQQVTFEPNPDGSPRKVNSINGVQETVYDAKGNVQNHIPLPGPVQFDIGYSTLKDYVYRVFSSSVKAEGEGSGTTTLVAEIDNPASNPTLAQQAELAGLSAAKVLIRFQIDEKDGVLTDYQEVAIDSGGKQTVTDEDKVTKVEVVPAPDFLIEGAP